MKYPPVIIVQLIHIHGPMRGEIQEFSAEVISIGRNPDSSLCFPQEMTSLSRKHAEIRREGNQFFMTDFSTNGTMVNGKRVKEALLKDGDVLEFSEGGPKVSFLTKMAEPIAEAVREAPVPERAPQHEEKAVVREEPPRRPVVETPPPMEVPPPPRQTPVPDAGSEIKPRQNGQVELSSQKVSAPLVVQYGPTIRSFRELPITIGRHPKSDFVLALPTILDMHLQIHFNRGQYWIKDMTGLNLIKINGSPISFQAPLNLNDIVSLSPQGPTFCFLGEGRLAEVAEPAPEPHPEPSSRGASDKNTGGSGEKPSVSFWSKFKDKF